MLLPRYIERLDARAEALATACVHVGDEGDPHTRALETLVLSNAFRFDDTAQAAGAIRGDDPAAYVYGRWRNPTVDALEAKVSALEGTEDTCATASGMSAVSGAVLAFVGQGDHMVAPRAMYSESAKLLRERLPRFGIETTFVDASEPGAYERAVRPNTRLLYLETPANPNLALTDLAAVAALARARGLLTVADNTFATPFGQTPHALGIDLVVHSMTKAMAGHGDSLGGAVSGRRDHVAHVRDWVIKGTGGVLSPLSAFLIARGLRTFALRQRQQCLSAAILARRLAEHPAVAAVHHPSLLEGTALALAEKQMHAFGAILSFELLPGAAGAPGERGSAMERGKRALERLELVTHAVSVGDLRSLAIHPASTTHASMPPEARAAARIGDGLIRLSVGIEGSEDLWRDLERALDAS
jgi:methionine-gamma-lyase